MKGPLALCWQATLTELLDVAHMPAAHQQEVRRGFYAGAQCLMQVLNAIVDLPEAERAAVMNSLQTELAVFQATVGTSLEGHV